KSTPVNGEMVAEEEEEQQVDPLDPTPVQASPKIRDWLPFRNPSVGLAVVEGGEQRVEGGGGAEVMASEDEEAGEEDWSEYDELFGDEERMGVDDHRVSHASSLGDAFQYSSENLLLDGPKQSG